MKRYLVLALRTPQFNPQSVGSHKAFLDELNARGLLLLTGGFADGSGGAYVLQNVDTLAQAQALVATDPLAIDGSSQFTVHEWNTR